MARAVGGWEGLGQVAALTQGDAVLEAGPTFRCALKREEKDVRGGTSGQHSERKGSSECGRRTSDQSRVTHLGGQDWLLQDSRSMGR